MQVTRYPLTKRTRHPPIRAERFEGAAVLISKSKKLRRTTSWRAAEPEAVRYSEVRLIANPHITCRGPAPAWAFTIAPPMAVPEMAMPVAAMTVATMSVPVSAMTVATMPVATMPVAVSMAAVSVAALGLCRNVSRGHQQTGYADGRETIDADQCGCCQAAGQESTNFALTVPGHFITSVCTLLLSLLKLRPRRYGRSDIGARRYFFSQRKLINEDVEMNDPSSWQCLSPRFGMADDARDTRKAAA